MIIKNFRFTDNIITILFYSLYSVFGIFYKTSFWSEGRIWAEEGVVLSKLINNELGFIESIFFIYHQHIEIISNVIVFFSSLFSLKYSPLFLTYCSFLIQSIPIFLIIHYRRLFKLSLCSLLALLALSLGVIPSSEVWMNSTCLHFHVTLLGVILFYLVLKGVITNNILISLIFLLLGLSSISLNFIIPIVAVYYFFLHRNMQVLRVLISLCISAVIQVSLLFNFAAQRALYSDILSIFKIFLYRTSEPINFGCSEYIQKLFFNNESFIFQVLILFFLIYVFLLNKSKCTAFLLYSSLFICFLSIFTSASPDLMHLYTLHHRYFYVPIFILYLGIFSTIDSNSISRKLQLVRLVLVFIVFLTNISNIKMPNYYSGNSWTHEYELFIQNNDTKLINITPNGWTMEITKENH